jgi:hypothetical protein
MHWRVALASLLFTSLCGAQTVLVRADDECLFFRGTQEPPADWADLDFDSAGWEWGMMGIGYADDDDATILSDMQNLYFSVYVRIDFLVPSGLDAAAAVLRVRYDDGFVAYIDGTEVARRGLTGVPPAYNEAAANHEITTPTGFDESIPLTEVGWLSTTGRHVLSVQVHNATIDSTDLSFAAELDAAPFVVTSVDPAFGPIEGGGTVAILGQGFDPADPPAVRFGGAASPSVSVVGTEELSAVVPAAAAAGVVSIEVQDSRGTFTLPDAYRYSLPGTVALSFDGTQYATAASCGGAMTEGTFEVWFRKSGGYRWVVLFAIEMGAGADAFRFELRGTNRLRARSWIGGTANNLEVQVEFGDTWHHLACTFSTSGRAFYLDGTLIGSDQVVMELPAGARFRLGAGFSAGSNLVGEATCARGWNSVRSAEDIRRLRFAQLGADDGVGVSWPLDEGGGQSGRDLGPDGIRLFLGDTSGVEASDPAWIVTETFPAAAVTAIDPARGPLGGGNAVTVFGTGFGGSPPPAVYFGSAAAPSVTVIHPWELEATAPAGSAFGRVDIVVEARLGTASLAAAYTYEPEGLETLVREGDAWDFFRGRSAPPATWKDFDFDPGAFGWEQGPTGIGYADDDDATVIDDMMGSYFSVFARREWTFTGDPSGIIYLVLRVRYDDGYVAYLNGDEVARDNLTGTPPAFDEAALVPHEITGGTGSFDAEIDLMPYASLVRAGRNVLAIEIHNATIDSTDLSLSAELLAAGMTPLPVFKRGDLNDDGAITISDPILLLRVMFLGREIRCLESADIEDNGALTVADPIRLLGYLFAGRAPPPPPFDAPGADVDGDDLGCEE